MVTSLGPAVRSADREPKSIALVFAAGAALGASLVGLAIAALGVMLQSLDAELPTTVVVVSGLAIATAQVAGLRVPQSSWQVPEPWRRLLDLDVLALFYGLILGVGFLTSVVVAAFWAFLAVTLAASPAVAIVAWLAYGSTRGLSTVLFIHRASPPRPISPREHRALAVAATATAFAAAITTL